MGQRLCVCGSTKKKAILDSWKEESWDIHINLTEVNQKLIQENAKSTFELAKERLKVQEIEDKQKEVQAELVATKKQLMKIQ